MTLMNIVMKIAEKNAEIKLNYAYKQSEAALSIFTKAKKLLQDSNKNLSKTQDEVAAQLSRLNLVATSIADEQARNLKHIDKINAILE